MTRPHPPRVLITGSSIAGPTLAWGLERAGFEVTLLERSAEQRQTGQNIDIRSIGRDVIRRMGIEHTVMQKLTGEEGNRFVDENGRPYAALPRIEGGDGPTAEVEILRENSPRSWSASFPEASSADTETSSPPSNSTATASTCTSTVEYGNDSICFS